MNSCPFFNCALKNLFFFREKMSVPVLIGGTAGAVLSVGMYALHTEYDYWITPSDEQLMRRLDKHHASVGIDSKMSESFYQREHRREKFAIVSGLGWVLGACVGLWIHRR